jgi:hypothetical protein
MTYRQARSAVRGGIRSELEAAGGGAAGSALPEKRLDRCRRRISRVHGLPGRLSLVVACLGSASLLAAGAALSAAGGQKAIRFLQVSRPNHDRLVDHNGNRRRDPGDSLMGTYDLYRWAGSKRGARIGQGQVICILATRTTGNCMGSLGLPGGTIRTLGYVDFDDRVDEVAVIGGTGAYVGAQGTFLLQHLGGQDSGRAVGTIRLVR